MKYHVSFDIDFKRHKYPGKFIALEGIDGSGKTIQTGKVVESLKSKGYDAVGIKEPTDLVIGKFIKEEVLSGKIDIPPVAIQYLFSADRSMHQVEIEELLKKGKIIITDRYFWSAVAYGIADRNEVKNSGEYLLVALSILSFYYQFIIPDHTFYLDISVEKAMSRLDKSEKEKEIYEQADKLEQIKRGYQWLINKFPQEFISIDATKSVGKVTEEISSFL